MHLQQKNVSRTVPRTADADTVIISASYIMYEKFKLDYNFRAYLEGVMLDYNFRAYLQGVMLSENVLRTRIKPTPYQKSLKHVSGAKSRVVNFQAANKQFSYFSYFSRSH